MKRYANAPKKGEKRQNAQPNGYIKRIFKPLKTSSLTRVLQQNYLKRHSNYMGLSKKNVRIFKKIGVPVFPLPAALSSPVYSYLGQFNAGGQLIVLAVWEKSLKQAKTAFQAAIRVDAVGRLAYSNSIFLLPLLSSPIPMPLNELWQFAGNRTKQHLQNRLAVLREFGLVTFRAFGGSFGWQATENAYRRLKPMYDHACVLFEAAMLDFLHTDELI